MGGKVLEYEAKTILNKGREEGLDEGIRGAVSALKKLNIPLQHLLAIIQEEYKMSLEAAKKYI